MKKQRNPSTRARSHGIARTIVTSPASPLGLQAFLQFSTPSPGSSGFKIGWEAMAMSSDPYEHGHQKHQQTWKKQVWVILKVLGCVCPKTRPCMTRWSSSMTPAKLVPSRSLSMSVAFPFISSAAVATRVSKCIRVNLPSTASAAICENFFTEPAKECCSCLAVTQICLAFMAP